MIYKQIRRKLDKLDFISINRLILDISNWFKDPSFGKEKIYGTNKTLETISTMDCYYLI